MFGLEPYTQDMAGMPTRDAAGSSVQNILSAPIGTEIALQDTDNWSNEKEEILQASDMVDTQTLITTAVQTHNPAPNSFESSFLRNIPIETLACISTFNSVSTTAAFALTCRAAYNVFGKRYFTILKKSHWYYERPTQLSTQDYFETQIVDGGKTATYRNKACHLQEAAGGRWKYIHQNLTFDIFQAMMKRVRTGLDYTYFLNLLNNKFESGGSLPYQCTFQARIVSGKLITKSEFLILTDQANISDFLNFSHFAICEHINREARYLGGEQQWKAQNLDEHIPCPLDHIHHFGECHKVSKIKQCKKCLIDYKWAIYEQGPKGNLIVIAKWMNMGEGKTIFDGHWFLHFNSKYTTDAPLRSIHTESLRKVPPPYHVGSVKKQFEPVDTLEFGTVKVEETIAHLRTLGEFPTPVDLFTGAEGNQYEPPSVPK
ncbi:hypothetical protein BJ875DRAFT_528299 [Amylocarpus encephaloides]|uniref:Uncharacterized protein n=1 Tax=Amylocarpus encephaloides TaxID=45428 RepID=A0A9P7Y6L7_9HELO|nr:hypothetical protein BJ875DRAFT_528299 [Amylocarpus encephaloides]